MAALSNCILSYGSPCVLVSLHYPFTVLLLVQNVHILFFFCSFNLFLILLLQYCYFLLFFCLALILALILPTYPSTTMNYFFFTLFEFWQDQICLQLVSWNELELLFVDNSSASFFPLISHAKMQACHQDWRNFCHLFNSIFNLRLVQNTYIVFHISLQYNFVFDFFFFYILACNLCTKFCINKKRQQTQREIRRFL